MKRMRKRTMRVLAEDWIDREDFRKTLRLAKKLRKHGPRYAEFGVCYNLDGLGADRAYQIIAEMQKSGDLPYLPDQNDDVWPKERYDLLDRLIGKLKATLEYLA